MCQAFINTPIHCEDCEFYMAECPGMAENLEPVMPELRVLVPITKRVDTTDVWPSDSEYADIPF